MVERGVVAKLKSKGKRAVVEFDRHAACDSCHMCAVTPTGKVSVTLENEEGQTKFVSVEDEWLTEKGLNVGDAWPMQGIC